MKNRRILKSMIMLALCMTTQYAVTAKEQVFNLPVFHVYGDRYKSSSLANKIPTAEKYTPSSVSTVDEKELEEKHARTIQDALSNETGLIGNYRGDIPFQNYVKIRGVELDSSNLLVDGMRAYSTYMQIFTPEIFGMEKVEVLRGPASTFQGGGAGGGVLNMQLKSPKNYDYAKGDVTIGTKNEKTVTFDINETNEEKNSAMRFVGLLSKKDLFFDESSNFRTYIAPSYEKQLEKDRFTIKPFYQYDHVTGSKDQPQIKLPNHRFSEEVEWKGKKYKNYIPDRAYLGRKDWDKYDLKQWGIITEWEHNINDNLSFVQRATARKTTVLSKQSRAVPNLGTPYMIDRVGTLLKLEGKSYGIDQYLRLHKETKKGSRDTIIGATWNYERTSQYGEGYKWKFWEIENVEDYLSGKKVWVEDNNYLLPTDNSTVQVTGREYGIYASHNEHIGKFHLSGGIRRGLYKQHSSDEDLPLSSFKSYATTGQVGLVYELTDEVLPYIHWNHGFRPNYVWDEEHNALPPTTSTEWESGIRYERRDGKAKGSIAAFNLIQHNVPSLVFMGSLEDSYFEPIGKVGSKGIDFKISKQIDETLNVEASYSFLIAKILEDKEVDNVGKSMSEAPKHTLAINAKKIIKQNEKGKLSVNAGVRYIGQSFDQSNLVKIGGATIYDCGITYERKKDSFNLQIKNLFDKKYFVSLYQDYPKQNIQKPVPGEHKPGNVPDEEHENNRYMDPLPNIGFLGDERAVTFTYSHKW